MRSEKDFIDSKVDILTDGDAGRMDIDYEKLEKYINIRLTLRDRDNGKQTFHKIPFRKCTIDDFSSRGLHFDPDNKNALKLRLCPAVDAYHQEFY